MKASNYSNFLMDLCSVQQFLSLLSRIVSFGIRCYLDGSLSSLITIPFVLGHTVANISTNSTRYDISSSVVSSSSSDALPTNESLDLSGHCLLSTFWLTMKVSIIGFIVWSIWLVYLTSRPSLHCHCIGHQSLLPLP